MNAKSVEEIAVVLRRMRKARDRIDGHRPLVVDLVRELSLGDPMTAAAETWVQAERDPAVLDPEDGFRLGQLVYGDLAPI